MDVLIGKVARELAALEEQLDRALERTFGTGVQLPGRSGSFRPAIDVYETREGTSIRVELAGVESKDVRLVVDGEYLQINGFRSPAYGQRPEQHLQMEIPQGSFARVLHLRAPFDPARVTATLQAGILTIELPQAHPRPRKISVTST